MAKKHEANVRMVERHIAHLIKYVIGKTSSMPTVWPTRHTRWLPQTNEQCLRPVVRPATRPLPRVNICCKAVASLHVSGESPNAERVPNFVHSTTRIKKTRDSASHIPLSWWSHSFIHNPKKKSKQLERNCRCAKRNLQLSQAESTLFYPTNYVHYELARFKIAR